MPLRRRIGQALAAPDRRQAAGSLWRRGHALRNVFQVLLKNGHRADWQRAFYILSEQHRAAGEWLETETGREEACCDGVRYEGMLQNAAVGQPVALACDPENGDPYVADGRSGAVWRLDPESGEATRVAGGFAAPCVALAFALDAGLWVATADGERLWRLDRRGAGRPHPLAALLPPGSPGVPLCLAPADDGLYALLTRPGDNALALARLRVAPSLVLAAWEPVDWGAVWGLGAGAGWLYACLRPAGPILRRAPGGAWEPFCREMCDAPLHAVRAADDAVFALAGAHVVRLDGDGGLLWQASLARLAGRNVVPVACDLVATPRGRRLYVADAALPGVHVLGV